MSLRSCLIFLALSLRITFGEGKAKERKNAHTHREKYRGWLARLLQAAVHGSLVREVSEDPGCIRNLK